MNDDALREVIFRILKGIAPESEPARLGPDDDVRRTLDIDSFDALTFFVRIHEELGIDVPESDYGRLDTLARMFAYFRSRLDRGAPAGGPAPAGMAGRPR